MRPGEGGRYQWLIPEKSSLDCEAHAIKRLTLEMVSQLNLPPDAETTLTGITG